jgi:hypothetical protein
MSPNTLLIVSKGNLSTLPTKAYQTMANRLIPWRYMLSRDQALRNAHSVGLRLKIFDAGSYMYVYCGAGVAPSRMLEKVDVTVLLLTLWCKYWDVDAGSNVAYTRSRANVSTISSIMSMLASQPRASRLRSGWSRMLESVNWPAMC